jgi:hypothetical protein
MKVQLFVMRWWTIRVQLQARRRSEWYSQEIQTEKIHGCLDQLEKYDFNKPNPKGVDLSSIAITPKPAAPKPKEVVAVVDTRPVITEHSPATKSTD